MMVEAVGRIEHAGGSRTACRAPLLTRALNGSAALLVDVVGRVVHATVGRFARRPEMKARPSAACEAREVGRGAWMKRATRGQTTHVRQGRRGSLWRARPGALSGAPAGRLCDGVGATSSDRCGLGGVTTARGRDEQDHADPKHGGEYSAALLKIPFGLNRLLARAVWLGVA